MFLVMSKKFSALGLLTQPYHRTNSLSDVPAQIS